MIEGLTTRNQRLPPAVTYAVTIRCITVAGRGEVVNLTPKQILMAEALNQLIREYVIDPLRIL